MESLTQMFAILAVFAVMHERVVEFLRLLMDTFEKKGWTSLKGMLEAVTSGPFNWVSGVALALLTHADLLEAARPAIKPENVSRFFELYLTSLSEGWTTQHFIGCVLMGFSTTLGSKFWHDVHTGLADIRKKVKGVSADAQKLIVSQVQQNLVATANQMTAKSQKDDTSAPVIASVAGALKDAAARIQP